MKSVLDYDDIVDFLQDNYSSIKAKRPKYSLRSWSQKIGFKSPASISRILSRTRKPTIKQVRTIAKSLNLDSFESFYLEAMVQCDPVHLKTVGNQLKKTINKNSPLNLNKLSIEKFELMSQWYYAAILESLSLKREVMSALDLTPLFIPTIHKDQVESAIADLIKLDLVEKIKDSYKRKINATNSISPEIDSIAVRQFHDQMLNHATTALKQLPREERDIRGITLAIKEENYKQAINIIDAAYNELIKLAENNNADRVYQLTTALFPLTKKI